MTLNLTNGNCLEEMKKIADKSVDLMICDLPYGETNCKWDIKIDMDVFWDEFKRIRKSKRTACIHFCSTKFGYELIKSWEKGYKMDMVWKKRNKTGGLQSRHRPMRNHEMVYFFYEQAPLYNRDKYHKRIVAKQKTEKSETAIYGVEVECKSNFSGIKNITFDPINPVSILEEDPRVDAKGKSAHGYDIEFMDKPRVPHFDPKLPASILEEQPDVYGETKKKRIVRRKKGDSNFLPPNPASVLEVEDGDTVYSKKGWKKGNSMNSKEYRDSMKEKELSLYYDPPNPASVLVETEEFDPWGMPNSGKKGSGNLYVPPNPASVLVEKESTDFVYPPDKFHGKSYKEKYGCNPTCYEPHNPLSVLEYDEDEPMSMYESKKVFIGKRHHQTEKPIDILEFFLKYWTNDGDTILDPTMGSGSTGVACQKIGNRNFIGFELNEDIFKVAKSRMNILD